MSKISRRDLFKAGAGAGLGALLPGAASAARGGGQSNQTDLTFVNGRIHTMDDKGSVVSAVAIRDGRFVAVGGAANPGPGVKVINLHGRTVVPGLIESHTHFVSLANRPGYHVAQWELASSIDEVLAVLHARRARGDVPEGGFITAMGAGTPRMFAELRLPTLSELDAAVPDRPVFLYQGGGGPARTNSEGKRFFESAVAPLGGPVVVQTDGTISGSVNGVNQANLALYHLRFRQTFEDKKRSALDAMAFTAQVGVTTNLDQTLVARNSILESLDPQPGHALFNLDHYRMYDAWNALHREGRAFVRLQINFLHNEGFVASLGALENQLRELRERLKNQFPFFGDDMLRTGGIGEWAAVFATPSNPDGYAVWLEAQRLCAKARWRNENSQAGSPTNTDNIQQVVETYEAMDAEFGIKELRWGLQHGDHATEDQLARLKALNCGLSTSGFRWLGGTPRADGLPAGPRFPRILASGIPAALHEDGVHIAPHNPWFALHYATTGLNVLGQQINPGQQISRQQALHMYTRGAAWFLNQEDKLGSIEVGKLADLLVLDRDYFSVSDAAMRRTLPVLTVIDGKIVHDAGVV